MTDNRKGMIIYLVTFLVTAFCVQVKNGKSILSILLEKLELPSTAEFSNSTLYFDGCLAIAVFLCSWIIISKVIKDKHSKYRYYYPLYFFVITFINGKVLNSYLF